MDASRIHQVPLFAELRRSERKKVARWADEVDVPAGAHLANEGDYAHEFFVIEEGTAEVTKSEIRQNKAELLALLDTDHHRTASVTATSPMRLVVMFQKEFVSMADDMPDVANKLRTAITNWQAADAERG